MQPISRARLRSTVPVRLIQVTATMIGLLLKKITPSRPLAVAPSGERIYAIGDIHGCADLLDALLEQIMADHAGRPPAELRLIFLGDLIDRGPDSARVVERAMAVANAEPQTRFLMGNHEEVFLKALDGDEKAMRFFCRIGGRETILSYGMSEDEYNRYDYTELADAMSKIVPDTHRQFLSGFEDVVIAGDYAFVHAGIRPGVPLAQQQQSDLRWIRDLFLDSTATHEQIIVHGHTIATDIESRANRIGIDTGAYASGKLSAMAFEGTERWPLAAISSS